MGAQSIEVAFAKGRRTRAEIVAQDFEVGLALLKVKRQGLPAAALGDGDALKPGTAVIALASTGTQERRVAGGLVIHVGEFEAYWEYLLGHSIVTSAPNQGFGRRGLFTRLWRHEPGERLILEVMRENKVRRVEVLGGDRAYFFRQL